MSLLRAAPNMNTPKGSSVHRGKAYEPREADSKSGGANPSAGSAAASAAGDLKKTRRRLSVMSDNQLVEGVSAVSLDDKDAPELREQTGCIVRSYAGYSKKGYAPYNPMKNNQDALLMVEDPATQTLLFAVMDGHGEVGDVVARHFKNNLASRLFSHPEFATNIEAAVRAVLVELERELLADTTVDTDFSGTTFVAACIRHNRITVANVGDSRCTLGYRDEHGNIVAEAISNDHKPDHPEERQRIIAAGGRVFAVEYDDGIDGPPRVWLGHMDIPGLAMSRSLGDTVAHTAGVSSEPDFFVRDLDQAKDVVLLLATDGLWEFMSDQECVDIAVAQTEPRFSVDMLIQEANDRWLKEEQVIDDTTVCVAFLGNFSPQRADKK